MSDSDSCDELDPIIELIKTNCHVKRRLYKWCKHSSPKYLINKWLCEEWGRSHGWTYCDNKDNIPEGIDWKFVSQNKNELVLSHVDMYDDETYLIKIKAKNTSECDCCDCFGGIYVVSK